MTAVPAIPQVVSLVLFIIAFLFVYIKKVVHTYANLRYRDILASTHHTLTSRDCTIIVPTVDASRPEFVDTIHHALATEPRAVIVATVGRKNAEAVETLIRERG